MFVVYGWDEGRNDIRKVLWDTLQSTFEDEPTLVVAIDTTPTYASINLDKVSATCAICMDCVCQISNSWTVLEA